MVTSFSIIFSLNCPHAKAQSPKGVMTNREWAYWQQLKLIKLLLCSRHCSHHCPWPIPLTPQTILWSRYYYYHSISYTRNLKQERSYIQQVPEPRFKICYIGTRACSLNHYVILPWKLSQSKVYETLKSCLYHFSPGDLELITQLLWSLISIVCLSHGVIIRSYLPEQIWT